MIKKKSLQKIQDFYERQGYKGEQLRKVLLKDKEYLAILKNRKQKLRTVLGLSKAEERKYILSTDEDYEILSNVKKLEKQKLNAQEKFLIKFIRTQLEHDWRKWIIKELNKIVDKYKIN